MPISRERTVVVGGGRRVRAVCCGVLVALAVAAGPASAASPFDAEDAARTRLSPAVSGGTGGVSGVLVRQVGAAAATPILDVNSSASYQPASSIKIVLAVAGEQMFRPTQPIVRYLYPRNKSGAPANAIELCPDAPDETLRNQQDVSFEDAETGMLMESNNRDTRAILLALRGTPGVGPFPASVIGPRGVLDVAKTTNTALAQDRIGCGTANETHDGEPDEFDKVNSTTLMDMSRVYAAIDSPSSGLLTTSQRVHLFDHMDSSQNVGPYDPSSSGFAKVVQNLRETDPALRDTLSDAQANAFVAATGYAFKAGSNAEHCLRAANQPPGCLAESGDDTNVEHFAISGLLRIPYANRSGVLDPTLTRTYSVGGFISGRNRRLTPDGNGTQVDPCANTIDFAAGLGGDTYGSSAVLEAERPIIRQGLLSIAYPSDPIPTAAISDPGRVASGTATALDASRSAGNGDPIASYSWDFGDGTRSTGRSPSHTYSAPGTYRVRLWVENAIGKGDITERTITVTAPTGPVAPIPGPAAMPPVAVSAPANTPNQPAASDKRPTNANGLRIGTARTTASGSTIRVSITTPGPGTLAAVATHTDPAATPRSSASTLHPGPGRIAYARSARRTLAHAGDYAVRLRRTHAGRTARFRARAITARLTLRYVPTDGRPIIRTRNIHIRIRTRTHTHTHR